MKRRIVALILSAAMVLSATPVSAATEAPKQEKTSLTVSQEQVTEDLESVGSIPVTLNAEEALEETCEEFSVDIEPNALLAEAILEDANLTVDESLPQIKALREELGNMTVEQKTTQADGTVATTSSGLTDQQIDDLVNLYYAYLMQWQQNADALGAQVPYYLTYNDREDGLGIMGEMFIIAGWTLEDIRAGKYTYDDLSGLILNFYYGDFFGVSNQPDLLGYADKGGFYRNDIINSRNEVLQLIKDSNCKTEAQKLLLINDWIGEHGSFNMPHVMNQGTSAKMLAPEPEQNEHYNDMFKAIYGFYTDAITKMLKDNIRQGVLGDIYQNTYDGYYWTFIDMFYGEETAAHYAEYYATEAYNDAANGGTIDYPVTDDAGNPVLDADGKPVVYPMTVDQIVDASMDTPIESFGGATPNQIIQGGANDAATSLADGVVGIWKSNLVGALSTGNVVCLGYSKAFQYLVQCMHPEVYTKSGKINDPSDWKSSQDLYYNEKGEIDPDKYNVDLVCIQFASDVSMYGIEQDEFNSDHYWNAVKVDGKWYYIDCCYIDVYSEVMIRDQVEADGSMNHLYFLISATTMQEMFKGNYDHILSLYGDEANVPKKNRADDQRYESSWFSRIKNAVGFDGTYVYYLYDSTDSIKMMNEFNSDDDNSMQNLMEEQNNVSYRLVRHKLTDPDLVQGTDDDGNTVYGADTNFETLVYLNYKADDNSDPVGYYLGAGKTPSNTSVANYTKSDELTKAYADYQDMTNIYASANLGAAFYNNVFYFAVGNAIFAYDTKANTLKCVKQYGVVNMERDPHHEFQGRAYTLTTKTPSAKDKYPILQTENAPIAGLQILDGKLLVSLSSNYSYISGKDDMADDKPGYSFQESGFNYSYNAFTSDRQEEQAEEYGYKMSRNDNDEFMFSAICHDTLDINNLKNANVTYRDIQCDHKFFLYRQNYYSLDDAKNFYYGASWICYKCGKNHEASYNDTSGQLAQMEQMGYDTGAYANKDGIENEVKGNTIYTIADGKWEGNVYTFSKLQTSVSDATLKSATGEWDYFNELDKIKSITLDEPVAVAATASFKEGEDCTTGGTLVYTAEGYTSEGFYFNETKEVAVDANTHVFTTKEEENNNNGGFGNWGNDQEEEEDTDAWTWSSDRRTATIDASKLACVSCGKSPEEVVSSDTFTLGGALAADTVTITKGTPAATANAITSGNLSQTTCTQSASKYYYADGKVTAEVTASKSEHEHKWDEGTVTTEAACETPGTMTYACTVEGCTATKTEDIKETGHDWDDGVTTTDPTCTAAGEITYTCRNNTEHVDKRTLKQLEHEYNEDGYCKNCGAANLDNHTHKYNESDAGTVKTAATCETDGVKEVTCTVEGCNETKEVAITKLNHKWDEGKVTKAATCTEKGEKVFTCQNDPAHTETKDIDINPEAHKWDEGKVTKPATCKEKGVKTFTCEYDENHIHNEDIDMADHVDANEDGICDVCEETITVSVDPDKTEASYTVNEGSNTINLGIVVVSCINDVAEVLGHSWSRDTWTWKKNDAGDAYVEATMKSTCGRSGCNYVESHAGVIAADKATKQPIVTRKEPTCTEAGSVTYSAKAKKSSGKVDSGNYSEVTNTATITLDPTGHDYNYVWTWAADNKTATLSQVCSVCNNKVNVATVNATYSDNLNQVQDCQTSAQLYKVAYKVSDKVELKSSVTVFVPAKEPHPGFKVVRELDSVTGETYDNKRCTKCNEVVEADLVYFTVEFVANGGSGTMEKQTVKYGIDTKLSANAFTRTGYTFKGWTVYRTSDKKWYAKNSKGTKKFVTKKDIDSGKWKKVTYANQASVAKLTTKNKDTVKLYAQWKVNTFKVAFNANGGKGKMKGMTYTYGKKKALTKNAFKKSGKKFKGWFAYRKSDKKWYVADSKGKKKWATAAQIKENGYKKVLTADKANVSKYATANGDTVTMYAQWK